MYLSYGCVSDEWNQPEQLLVAAATVEPSFYGFTNYWNMVFYQAGTVRLAGAERFGDVGSISGQGREKSDNRCQQQQPGHKDYFLPIELEQTERYPRVRFDIGAGQSNQPVP